MASREGGYDRAIHLKEKKGTGGGRRGKGKKKEGPSFGAASFKKVLDHEGDWLPSQQ